MNNVNIEQVSSVYSGKNGSCCCGCAGKHTYASAHRTWASKNRGYNVGLDEVNDRVVSTSLTSNTNIMKQRISTEYRFTIHGTNDFAGQFQLTLLKSKVTRHNQNSSIKYRVCLKGRLGKNNPHAHLYQKGGPRHWALKSGAVKLEHAGHFDVYVYRKF